MIKKAESFEMPSSKPMNDEQIAILAQRGLLEIDQPATADAKKNFGGMFWRHRPPRVDKVPKDTYWPARFMGQVTVIIPSRKLAGMISRSQPQVRRKPEPAQSKAVG